MRLPASLRPGAVGAFTLTSLLVGAAHAQVLAAPVWNGNGFGAVTGGAPGSAIFRAIDLPGAPGSFVTCGTFTNIGGVAATNVAVFNGTTWAPMGAGLPAVPSVQLLAPGPTSGTVLAGVGTNVFFFNGVAWSAQPVAPSPVYALATRGGATVISHNQTVGLPGSAVQTLSGGIWTNVGAQQITGGVLSLGTLPNGDLIAGGLFQIAGIAGNVTLATCNGTTWTPVAGMPVGAVQVLRVLRNGDVAVAVNPASGNPWSLHRLSGTTLTTLATSIAGSLSSITELPNGDLVVGGSFTQIRQVVAGGAARFDGTTWYPMFGTPPNNAVNVVEFLSLGRVAVGGVFTQANGAPANFLSSFDPLVRPQVRAFGTGCTGSGGLNTLANTNLPFIGSNYTAVANGMSAGFAIQIRGVTAVPGGYPIVFPGGTPQPGCLLYESLDLMDTITPVAGGRLQVGFAIPYTASLMGSTLYHQVASFDGSMRISSTNADAVIIGGI